MNYSLNTERDYVLNIKCACSKVWFLFTIEILECAVVFTSTAASVCVCVCVCACVRACVAGGFDPHVQDQIPERLSALLGCAFQAGLDELWWCGSVSHGLAYILMYFLFFLSFNTLFLGWLWLQLSLDCIRVFLDSSCHFWCSLDLIFFSFSRVVEYKYGLAMFNLCII